MQDQIEAVNYTFRMTGTLSGHARANIVVELGESKVTPPVACGLLAGTFRAELLERREIGEACVSVADLRRASRIWLINSVHGWRLAVMS